MKRKMTYRISSLLVLAGIFLSGCIQEEEQTVPTSKIISKPSIVSPLQDSLYQDGEVFFDWQAEGDLEYQLYLWEEGTERDLKSPFRVTKEKNIAKESLSDIKNRRLYNWQLFVVDNKTGQGVSTDEAQFKVAKLPVILDSIVYPTKEAEVTLGDKFTVYGKHFGKSAKEVRLSMGGETLEIAAYSDSVFIAKVGSRPSEDMGFRIVYPIGGVNYQEEVKIAAEYLPKLAIPFRIDSYQTVRFGETKLDFQIDGLGFGESDSEIKIVVDDNDLTTKIENITDRRIVLSIEKDILENGNMVITKDKKERSIKLTFPGAVVPNSFRADIEDKKLDIIGVGLKSGGTVTINFIYNDGNKSVLEEKDFLKHTNDSIKLPFNYSVNGNVLVRAKIGEQTFDVGYISVLTQNSALDEDKQILQTIFEANGGLKWEKSGQKVSLTWLEQVPLSESWVGVKISDIAGIDTLDLSGFGLEGKLVEDIKRLTSLKLLKLSNNPKVYGDLPQEMCDRVVAKELEIIADNTQYNDLCMVVETELNSYYNQKDKIILAGKNFPTGTGDAKLDFIYQGDKTETVRSTLDTEIQEELKYQFDIANTKDSIYTIKLNIKGRTIKKWENVRIRRKPVFFTDMDKESYFFDSFGVILGENFPKDMSDVQVKLKISDETKILVLEKANYTSKQIVAKFPPMGSYTSGDYTVEVFAFGKKVNEWNSVSVFQGKINTNLTSKILYRENALEVFANQPLTEDKSAYKLVVQDPRSISQTKEVVATSVSSDKLKLTFDVTKANVDFTTWKLYLVQVKENDDNLARWVDVSLRDYPTIDDAKSNVGDNYHLRGDTLILKGTDFPSPSENILQLNFKKSVLKPIPANGSSPLTELKFEVKAETSDYGSTNQKMELEVSGKKVKEWTGVHILNLPFVQNQNQLQNRVLFLSTQWNVEVEDVVYVASGPPTLPRIEDYKMIIKGINVGDQKEKADTLKAVGYNNSTKSLKFNIVAKNLTASNSYNKKLELYLEDKKMDWEKDNLSLREKPKVTNTSEINAKYYEADLIKLKLDPMVEPSEYNRVKLEFYELSPVKQIIARNSLDNGKLVFNLNNQGIEGNPAKFRVTFLDTMLYEKNDVRFIISPKPKIFTQVYAYLADTLEISGTNFLEKAITDLVFENGDDDKIIPAAVATPTLLKFPLPKTAVNLPLKKYTNIRLRSDNRFSDLLGGLEILERPTYESSTIKRFYFANQKVSFKVNKLYSSSTGIDKLNLKGAKEHELEKEALINDDMIFNLSTVNTGSYKMDVVVDSRKLTTTSHDVDVYNPKFSKFVCKTTKETDGRLYIGPEKVITGLNFPHTGYLDKDKQKIKLINDAGATEYETDLDLTSVSATEIKYTIPNSVSDDLLDNLSDAKTNPNRVVYTLDGLRMDSCVNMSLRKLPKYKISPPAGVPDFSDSTLYVTNQITVDPTAFENLPNLNTEESLVKLFLEGVSTPTISTEYKTTNKLIYPTPSVGLVLPFKGKMSVKVDNIVVKEWMNVNVRNAPYITSASNITGRIYDTKSRTISGNNFPPNRADNQFKLVCGADEQVQSITSNTDKELVFTIAKKSGATLPANCKMQYIIDGNLVVKEWAGLSLRKNPVFQDLAKSTYSRGETVSVVDNNKSLSDGDEDALTIFVGDQPVSPATINILSSGLIQFSIPGSAPTGSNIEIEIKYDGILMKTYSSITIN